MLRHLMLIVLAAAALIILPGCDDSDASNVQIEVKADFSGTIRSTRLVIADQAHSTQAGNTGITWTNSAQVVTATGSFANLGDVHLEDMVFTCGSTGKGLAYLRVTLPRGEKAKWPAALTVPSDDQRSTTHKAVFPEQKDSKLGSVIAITITLPAEPISHGIAPRINAIKESGEKNVVTLMVPVSLAMKAGEAIVWDVTWSEKGK